MPHAKFIIPAVCLASTLTAFAQTARFTGAVDATWETPGNWTATAGTPSLPPGAADTAAFFGGTATLAGDVSVGRLTVSSLSTGPTTLQGLGAVRTINMSGTTPPSVAFATTLDQVVLSKGSGVSGGMTVFTGMTLANNGGISWAGTSALTFNSGAGAFSVGGSGAINVTAGSIGFTGANTTTIGSGVAFSSSSTVTASQGTLDIASSSGSLSGFVLFNSANSATLQNSGALSVGALTVNTSGSNGGTDAFANTGVFSKTGAGALAFSNTGTGSYSLQNSGTMSLGGSGTVTFDVGLSQSAGVLDFAGATVVLNQPLSISGGSVIGSLSGASGSGAANLTGATLSPGAGVGQVGSIALPGALTLDGGTLAVDINSNVNGDAVTAAGVVTLTGSPTLSVTAPNALAYATAFTILSGSNLTGTFDGLNNNDTLVAAGAANQQFRINYSGTDVTLTAVPEPRSIAAGVGLGLLGFVAWRRSSKRA